MAIPCRRTVKIQCRHDAFVLQRMYVLLLFIVKVITCLSLVFVVLCYAVFPTNTVTI